MELNRYNYAKKATENYFLYTILQVTRPLYTCHNIVYVFINDCLIISFIIYIFVFNIFHISMRFASGEKKSDTDS